ncbi:MAG: 1-acyl-sn-glycerol-3-phosphate acyltransferase [Acidobacteriota bacterium]|nr:1-acyl-sn-glycerol-3-phosphate acyltransferase [Acidobacteriota bacterium]
MAQLGLDFPTKWGRGYVARFVRNLYWKYYITPLILRMSTLSVVGLEHVEARAPLIFVANHNSHLDTPLLLSALPPKVRQRTIVAAAMDNFFMTTMKAFRTVLVFNAIPIDRHRINRRSSQLALELVEDHWNLLLYPEGGRSPDGNLQEFKGGAAYLAERSKAYVIPTYIHEAGYLRGPKYAKAPQYTQNPSERRHHVVVTFGEPLRAEPSENIRRFGARIEEAVAELGRNVSGDPQYGRRPSDEY